MKKFLSLVVGIVAMASAAQANAGGSRCPDSWVTPNSTVAVSSYAFNINEGATETVKLCRPLRLHKLFIQAEGYYNDAYAQVIVNGNVKGTLYVPGRDPSYVVTVEEDTTSIQIQSIRGNVKISNITAVISEANGGGYPSPGPGPNPGFPNRPGRQFPDSAQHLIEELKKVIVV